MLFTCCVRPCKSLGSITNRCSGKWARTHPPEIKTRKSSSGRIKDRTRETAEIEPTKSHVTLDSKGAFRSTKTFENQKTRANGREISRKCFQKFGKLLNFRNANHLSTENSRNLGSDWKVEWNENFPEKVSEDLGTPREVVLLLKILENAVPLIRSEYWKMPKIQTGLFA